MSLTKYHNSNNTIRVAVVMMFIGNLQIFSPKVPAEQSLTRFLLLTAHNEKAISSKIVQSFIDSSFTENCQQWKISAVKSSGQFHLNLFYYLSSWFQIQESQNALSLQPSSTYPTENSTKNYKNSKPLNAVCFVPLNLSSFVTLNYLFLGSSSKWLKQIDFYSSSFGNLS